MHFFLWLLFSCVSCFLHSTEEYQEPEEVATTEGLPSSLVNQSVCAITGEYTDSMLDVCIAGPEPLILSRTYASFAFDAWSYNHFEVFTLYEAYYKGVPSYLLALRRPSGARLGYVHEKQEHSKLKKLPFTLVPPVGLTNGGSILSGKTNVKNQKVHVDLDQKKAVARTGDGSHKFFKVGREIVRDGPFTSNCRRRRSMATAFAM